MQLDGSPGWGLKGTLFLGAVLGAGQKASCPWRSPWENDEGPKGALKWSLKETCGEHWGQSCRAKGLLTAQGSPREGQRMPQRVLLPS